MPDSALPLTPHWRVIPLETPTDPLYNMAVDEYLLCHQKNFVPTLRFYAWSVPSLSIGYFQNVQEIGQSMSKGERGEGRGESNARSAQHAARSAQPENSVIASEAKQSPKAQPTASFPKVIVRRLTGGGIVEHGQDLTVSFVLNENHPLLPKSISDSYCYIHQIFKQSLSVFLSDLDLASDAKGLSPRSNRACFEEPSRYDLTHHNKKVVGTSQRRKNNILLSQSSIMTKIPTKALNQKILQQFKATFKAPFEIQPFTSQENKEIQALVESQYAQPNFSQKVISLDFT